MNKLEMSLSAISKGEQIESIVSAVEELDQLVAMLPPQIANKAELNSR
jgi:hypothetical protein